MARPVGTTNRTAQTAREILLERSRLRASLNPYFPVQTATLPPSSQFLGMDHGAPFRPQDPQETPDERSSRIWDQVFEEERATLESTTRSRTRVAWRFVREILRILDLPQRDESLELLTPPPTTHHASCNPWRENHTLGRTPREPGSHRAWRTETALASTPHPGFSLLPPPPTSNQVDPENEPSLIAYCRTVQAAAEDFGYAQVDSAGVAGLSHPGILRLSFPNPVELVQFERMLIAEFHQLIKLRNRDHAYEQFRILHFLEEEEINLVYRLACKRIGTRNSIPSPEERRAIAVMQCEESANRMQDLDPRAEATYRKAGLIASGVSRIEPEAEDGLMFEALKKIASQPPRALLPTPETQKPTS